MSNASRQALIIANSNYTDSKLSELSAPEIDAEALAAVLRDAAVGFFHEVTVLRNENVLNVRLAIERFFSNKGRDDTLLLYFSGHGVLDPNGRLYLAAANTDTQHLRATGVPAQFIAELMDTSRSRRQILILDCCHSGAFARHSKAAADRPVGTASAFRGDGTGRVILTATDSTQHAWEGDQLIRGDGRSRFTHHLVEGLKTGKADRYAKGRITVDDLYHYVYEQVRADSSTEKPQTPQKWGFVEGELLIANNPHVYPLSRQPLRRIHGVVTQAILRQVMSDLFEEEQINNIAFDLGLDERSLGATKDAKLRTMLRQLHEQGRLAELLDWLQARAPEPFEQVFGEREAVQLEPPPQPKRQPAPQVKAPVVAQPAQQEAQAARSQKARPETTTSPPADTNKIPLWGWGLMAAVVVGLFALLTIFNRGGAEPPVVDGIVWIEIPAGPFMMGAAEGDTDAREDESPLHELIFDTYWISQTEITNAQYKEFVDDTGHRVPFMTREDYSFLNDEQYAQFIEPYVDEFNWDQEKRTFPEGKANHPVTQVSWEDAVAYTAWLSEQTGANITLPSEAEWEKAARGDGAPITYPGGNEWNCANLNADDETEMGSFIVPGGEGCDGFIRTAPVGSFPSGASPYGVLDMSGNVWEWTRSIYDQDAFPYPYDPTDGRENVTNADALRVLRGGSFIDDPQHVRVSVRAWNAIGDRNFNLGFRVVAHPPSP